jgi:hypothetical protein
MAVCAEEVPPELTFGDGVRVACHLYTADGVGRPVTIAEREPAVALGGSAADPA